MTSHVSGVASPASPARTPSPSAAIAYAAALETIAADGEGARAGLESADA